MLGILIHESKSDLLLLLENLLGDLALIPEAGIESCDLHCNILADLGSVDAALNSEVDEHADLAACVDICHGGVLGVTLEAADLEILADGHDLLGQSLGNGELGAGVLAVHESLNILGVVLEDYLADILNESDEKLALCAEVGLAVDLDNGADAALGADLGICHAFCGDASGLLCGLGKALLTQPLDCLIHIAVGLGQGLLAVHHTDIGHLTESFYILSGKSHYIILLSLSLL